MPEITLIPKKEKPEFKISFQKIIFYLPLTLFILVILVYGGFFFYNFVLNKSISSVNEEITTVEGRRDLNGDKEFVETIFSLNNRLANLKGILDNHIHGSAFFPFLEKLTLPKTSYSSCGVDFGKASVSLSGQTDGYLSLIKQMIVFQKSPDIEGANFSGITLSPDGKITFSLSLKFNKKILLESEESEK